MLSFIIQTFHETDHNIPEPGTLLLLGMGLIGFVLSQWRRRQT